MPTNPDKFIKTGPVFSEIIGQICQFSLNTDTQVYSWTALSAGEILAKSFPVEKLSVAVAGFLIGGESLAYRFESIWKLIDLRQRRTAMVLGSTLWQPPTSPGCGWGMPSRMDKRVAPDKVGAVDKQCLGEGKLLFQTGQTGLA